MLNIHHGAKPSNFENAQDLRRRSTDAEQLLWTLLRNRQLKGKKFRRQHPIAHYVADFYCHECKLIVELDGHHHKNPGAKKYDQIRTTVLNDLGVTVLRFWNDEVLKDPAGVLKRISDHLG